VDLGLGIWSASIVTSASREGARVAAALPDVLPLNDGRVSQVVEEFIEQTGLPGNVDYGPVEINGPRYPSSGEQRNSTGALCNNIVTVYIQASYQSFLLGIFGIGTFSISSATSMRHDNGELCD